VRKIPAGGGSEARGRPPGQESKKPGKMQQRRFTVGCTLIVFMLVFGLPTVLLYREWQQESRNRALIAAIYRNDAKAVNSLLDAGADPNTTDDRMYLLDHAPTPMVQQFLAQWVNRLKGKQPLPSYGHSALWVTILDRHFFPLDWPNTSPSVGQHLLEKDDVPILRALLDHGANPDTKLHEEHADLLTNQAPPLVYGALLGRLEELRLLLDHGADPNGTDARGGSAILCAGKSGASLNGVYSLQPNRFAIISLLLNHGADVNLKNKNGTTPLMQAAGYGDAPLVHYLLSHGADISARDIDGHSALHRARQDEYVTDDPRREVQELLKHMGAKD